MLALMTEVLPSSPTSPPPATAPQAAHHGDLFHTILSDLNPLQYIPVVGTIYRAVTGDQGNPTLRFVASLGTSFALGGPIGVAITAGEEAAGIHPEKMLFAAARHLFHLDHGESAPVPSAPPTEAADTQLAFAIDSSRMSADDLNGLELRRLATASAPEPHGVG